MVVNIIHLSETQCLQLDQIARDTEAIRRQSFMEEMAIQRAAYIVWDGVVDRFPFVGIRKAHQRIIYSAKQNKLPMVCVMESDAKFTHPDSYKYFLKHLPKSFDMYAGVLYHGTLGENNRLITGGSAIMTLYIIHQRFYDTFLTEFNNHIDRCIGDIAQQHEIIICRPHVVTQSGGYSYNHKRMCYYDEYLRDKLIYNGDQL